MNGSFQEKTRSLLLMSVLIGGFYLLMIERSYADPLQSLRAALPNQVAGWRAESNDRLFDDETIFDYINGAGEVYRAYNMGKCLSRRYTTLNGPPIVLDIFDMRSSEDAFGVFTHDQDGEPVDVGQGSLYRSGWLSFWKDRFFVSIYMEEESAAAEKAVRRLAKEVASLISHEGPKPRILSLLPQKGLQPKTIRYLYHYIVLNYHFYVADQNILNLGPDTKAALAEYKRGEENTRLLLVQYPERRRAEKAHKSFLKTYLPEASSTGPVLLENRKWSAAALRGKLLVIVLEADSQGLAESLMREVKKLD
jgi:hypothetical protein